MEQTIHVIDSMGSDATVYAAGAGTTVETAKEALRAEPAFVVSSLTKYARGTTKAAKYKGTLRQPFETVAILCELNMGWGKLSQVQRQASLIDHSPLTLPTGNADVPRGYYKEKHPQHFVGRSDDIEFNAHRQFDRDHLDVIEAISAGVSYPSALAFASPASTRSSLASINLMEAYEAYARVRVFGGVSREAEDAISDLLEKFKAIAPLSLEALKGGLIGV